MVETNPHGNGFSIRTKRNTIEFFKGRDLSPQAILEIIEKEGFKQGDKIEFVFHARITSHGSTCNELECSYKNPNPKHLCGCHGFVLSENMQNPQRATLEKNGIILYHNGTMNFTELKRMAQEIISIKKKRGVDMNAKVENLVSDTNALAYVVSNLGIKFLEKFAEKNKSSKFCIHSVKDGVKRFNDFKEQNKNIICSNLNHTWGNNMNFGSWYYGKKNEVKQTNQKITKFVNGWDCPFFNPDCAEHDYTLNECMTELDLEMLLHNDRKENLKKEIETVKRVVIKPTKRDLKDMRKQMKLQRKQNRKQKRKLKRHMQKNPSVELWKKVKGEKQ